MDRSFTIGELARQAGVGVQTVRYYERKKLLLPAGRKESGYRLYDENAAKRLRFIRHAKTLGFTLDEIRNLLELRVGPSDACERVKARTEARLKTVEQKIAALESVRKILNELVESCNNRRPTDECPILRAIEEEGV